MPTEVFKTRREFNNRFPSGLYICSDCLRMITDPYICTNCGQQSNTLFKDLKQNYSFVITEETKEIMTIFTPIEQQKGDN